MLPFTSATLFLALSALCLGCGTGTFSPLTPAPPIAGLGSAPATTYHAYGDSITVGYALPNPTAAAYPYLLSQAKALTLSNFAISGDQACDIPTRQIFPNADSPTTALPTLYTVLISTNDAAIKGTGPYEHLFNLCHQASLAWLATPLESKIFASAAVPSGPTHIDTFHNFNSVTTDALNASLTFTFSLAVPRPVYLWYRIVDGSPGTFTYAIDGTVFGTATTGTIPTISTQNGTSTSLALLRLPSIPAGSHTLTLTQTSPGSDATGFVAMGIPPATRPTGLPRVLVGTTPLQLAGNSACAFNSALCPAYVADITANVNLLAADGLDIELFDSRKYMTGTPADLADQVHPNALGHQEILHALTDIY